METRRSDIVKQIGGDSDLWAEILEKVSTPDETLERFDPDPRTAFELPTTAPGLAGLEFVLAVGPDELEGLREQPEEVLKPENLITEAIIRRLGRPVLKVKNDDFDPEEFENLGTEIWKNRLEQHREILKKAVLSVGRVELENNPYYSWVGTGWVVDEDVIVTNRHVASEFAKRRDERFVFRQSMLGEMAARLDFREEYQEATPAEFQILEVLHIEEDAGPDVAFLRIDWGDQTGGAPRVPIALAAEFAEQQWVAVIGYPAKDSRTRMSDEMDRIFGNIYDVKRLAPGQVMRNLAERGLLTHDSTTLGGNSGSVVLDMDSGEAVGLHFGGREESANYAVTAPVVKAKLEAVLAKGLHPIHLPVILKEDTPPTESLAGRTGYDVDFLGKPVPLPALSPELRQQVAPVIGRDDGLLQYSHYSAIVHATRRMAIYGVCNIDGKQWRRVPRGSDRWLFDPRLDRAYQAGNELYKTNKLDRGHLVRRLDPAWGDTYEEAELAAEDTFFYTNCLPQHKELNRELWLGLEDHILGNTDVHDLKVSVFNGPIFRMTDRSYRGYRIPEDFWKVVVMVREDTGQLSATAYLLSQLDFMDDLEFAFGPYRTYQVPVQQIESLTGLDFGDLRGFDPLAEREAKPYIALESLADIAI
jgi:endonuclease G